jgi:hypothetical protein
VSATGKRSKSNAKSNGCSPSKGAVLLEAEEMWDEKKSRANPSTLLPETTRKDQSGALW